MDQGSEAYRKYCEEGDEEAFVWLIQAYREGLIYFLCGIVHDIARAEELAEDAFVRIGTRRPPNRGGASFKTWLYTVGRNLAISDLRRSRRMQAVRTECLSEMQDEEGDLEARLIGAENRLRLHRVMRGLKWEYYQVLWLIYFEEMSCKDAARVMRKSTHAIETLVYRARIALKRALEKEGFVYEEL